MQLYETLNFQFSYFSALVKFKHFQHYLRVMYPFLRDILFNFDAEAVHYFSMNLMKRASNVAALQKMLAHDFQFSHPSLEKQVFGLPFKNPVGLGAGFDKNALYLR